MRVTFHVTKHFNMLDYLELKILLKVIFQQFGESSQHHLKKGRNS